jgi:hypothetical protein
MEEICINDSVKITRDKTIYKIEFNYSSYQLIKSLITTRIILGASTDEYYKTLKFKANSVKTLTHYLQDRESNKTIFQGVTYLATQLNYLITQESCSILGYSPNDILVINDDIFIFIGIELISSIKENEMITISSPFSNTDFFVSPEMLKINELPSFIHYKTAYFSLAVLIIYCLVNNDDFYIDYLKHKQPEKILERLNNHPIKNTRMYWLLSRCLVEEAVKRSIILI